MPSVHDKYAEIVIGTSSLIKRGTLSQLLEAACGMHAQSHMSSSIPHSTETILASYASNYRIKGDVTNSVLTRHESEVQVLDMKPMRKVNTSVLVHVLHQLTIDLQRVVQNH